MRIPWLHSRKSECMQEFVTLKLFMRLFSYIGVLCAKEVICRTAMIWMKSKFAVVLWAGIPHHTTFDLNWSGLKTAVVWSMCAISAGIGGAGKPPVEFLHGLIVDLTHTGR